jgi:hypothetical protein
MATMHQPDNDAGSGAADLSNGPDVVSNPANDTVNAGRWAAAVACPAHWKSRRRGAVEPVSLAIRSDKGVSAGIASVHRIVRSVEVGLLAGFAETADPRSGTARSRVAVAAYSVHEFRGRPGPGPARSIAIRRGTRRLSGAGMMASMVCETRGCRGRGASGSSCHFVRRRPRACNRRPGDGPVGHDGVGRYYDPQTGQFLSVDPEVQQTLDAYVYVGDDPVNGIDPLGLCWLCKIFHRVVSVLTSAATWAANRVNSAACQSFALGGLLSGWIRQQAGCTSTGWVGIIDPRDLYKPGDAWLERFHVDPHAIKEDLVGKQQMARFDIWRSKSSGDLYVGPKQGGGSGYDYKPTYIRIRDGKRTNLPPDYFDDEGEGFGDLDG